MGEPEDELARTATAPGATGGTAAPELGAMLGRYRLERTLGEGGMGVVHAAFDPDLERHVALKVLRTIDVAGDARQRLLREARAMARLTHENVVVVHEVGTAGDRDYVAMELIDGQTLAEWLAGKPREVDQIVDSFCAAGRGLAAAHAAGLVHRDFKPHNVLRRRDGKIVVTDFGLARGVETTGPAVAFDVTLRPGSSAPSGLSGLTVSGQVMGTPAYMAPEQWSGGTVGPAADQFAFCVAMWEALTGARPFRGETVDELKQEVKAGPAQLDQSKLPRRLRRTLVRGLDPDPAKRWPSMDALLTAIRRSDRRAGVAFMLAGGALVAGGVAMVLLHGKAPACEPPATDPSQVWSQAFAVGMPSELSELFNAQISHWAVARATACTAEPLQRPQQLHCLDGVLARMDVVRKAYSTIAKVTDETVAEELVDPSVCLGPTPPRLTLPNTPDTVAAYHLIAQGDADPQHRPLAQAQALADRPGLDPCSRALALVAVENDATDFQTKRNALTDAVAASEQCEDDRLHASLLLAISPYQFELPVIGPRGMAAINRAHTAVTRVAEPQLTARIDILRGMVASQQDHWKEALDLLDHAVAQYEAVNQPRAAIRTALEAIELRFNRSSTKDIEQVRQIVAKWLPVARTLTGPEDAQWAEQLARDEAMARFWLGDMVGGHADLIRMWKPTPSETKHKIEGDVVDRDGRPVAGAQVAAAARLYTDPVGVVPIGRYHVGDFHLRMTTTDEHGHFTIPDGPEHGAVIAQLGDRRSVATMVADKLKLVLQPTRTLTGKVTLGGFDFTQGAVVIVDPADPTQRRHQLMAMIMPDGTFTAAGVPQTKVNVGVGFSHDSQEGHVRYTEVPAGKEPVTGLALDATATTRTLDVIARSRLTTPLDTAQIVVVAGKQKFSNVGELNAAVHTGVGIQFARHVAGEGIPHDLMPKFRTGDLVAHFTDIPAGDITVCAVALPGDMMDDEAMKKIESHVAELDLACEVVDGVTKMVVVSTAPQKQFD
jgi:predicted Ser/Thr protein kinase